MTTPSNTADAHNANYRSGVAARLAGIPVETLRVWERRYKVVGPSVSPSGQRLYSSEQIRRLVLIKQLVDMGHPIGAIAILPTDALITMRATSGAMIRTGTPEVAHSMLKPARVALIGPLLSSRRIEQTFTGSALQITSRCMNLTQAADVLQPASADVVVMEVPLLNDGLLDSIANVRDMCGAKQVIILYRFAPSAVIKRLRAAGHEVARAPSDAIEIESLCLALLRLPQVAEQMAEPIPTNDGIPPSRFDEQTLAELASASSSIYCECPRHLVELITNLNSFEQYSADCENRDQDDATLHRELHQAAAQARSLLEVALLRVALHEGLPIRSSATYQQ